MLESGQVCCPESPTCVHPFPVYALILCPVEVAMLCVRVHNIILSVNHRHVPLRASGKAGDNQLTDVVAI